MDHHQLLKILKKDQKIDKITTMIKALPLNQAMPILKNLSLQLQREEPELYKLLKLQLYDPENVLKQLDRTQATLLMRSLPEPVINPVLKQLSPDTIASLGFKPVSAREASPRQLECLDTFYATLRKLQAQGTLPMMDLLEQVVEIRSCPSPRSVFQEKVRLMVEEELIPVNSSLTVMVYREHFAGKQVLLKLKTTEDSRPQSLTIASAILLFDESGFATWTSEALDQTGLYEVLLENSDAAIVARKWVGVGKVTPKSFGFEWSLREWTLESNNEGVSIEMAGTVWYRKNKPLADLKFTVWCATCGQSIAESHVVFKAGEETRFKLQWEVQHHGPWFIHYTSKTGIQGTIPLHRPVNLEECQQNLKLSTKALKSGLTELQIRGPRSSTLLDGFIVSHDLTSAVSHLREQVTAPLTAQSYSEDQFQLFNGLIRNGDIPFPAPSQPLISQTRMDGVGDHKKTYRIPVSLRYSQFWKWCVIHKLNGRLQLTEKTSIVPTLPLEVDFPGFILPKDKVCGKILYQVTGGPHTLKITDVSKSEEIPVQNDGEVEYWLTENSVPEIALLKGDQVITKTDWSNASLGHSSMKVQFLKPRTEFQSKSMVVLYPDMKTWLLEVAEALMTYSCRCAEQTSSIIGGLLVIRKLLDEGYKGGAFDLEKVNAWLDKELLHLSSMQNSVGEMTLWKPGPDRPFHPYAGLNIAVLDNLEGLPDLPHETGVALYEKLAAKLETETGNAPDLRYKNPLESSLWALKKIEEPPETQLQELELLLQNKLLIEDNRMVCDLFDHFKYGNYFLGAVLEFLSLRGNAPMTMKQIYYIKTKAEEPLPSPMVPIKKSHKLLDSLLSWFHRTDQQQEPLLPPEQKTKKIRKYRKVKVEDPVWVLLRSLASSTGYNGYWGTIATVAILKSLLKLAEEQSFEGDFEINGKPFKPEQKTPVKGNIKVISPSLAGVKTRHDPIKDIEAINNTLTECEVLIDITPRDRVMKLGQVYELSINVKSREIQHPQIKFYHSGLVTFLDLDRNADLSDSGLFLSVEGHRTVKMKAIRQGQGRLLGKVSDMYHPALAYRTEFPLQVE
ncbi:MAG: hypothetical protein HQM12_18110 [SAR324 cluster bacterium]|nr:hypothetical protein [SAR324 cluster bacterium]